MTSSIFISLPVADLAVSIAFYEAIGCTRDPRFSGDQTVAMIWSDTITFMLASHEFYGTLSSKPIGDAATTSTALFALSCETRAAVDAFAAAGVAAGGREVHGAEDHGFMYSRGIEDPDGHGFGPMWIEEASVQKTTVQAEPVL